MTESIDAEGRNIPGEPRFPFWCAVLLFSCVCIAAQASTVVGSSSRDAAQNWVLAALSFSLIFSFTGVAAHFVAKDRFVGERPEGLLAGLTLLFWICSLPVIMDPSKNIAVTTVEQQLLPAVFNSNLYFFSWICFACVLYIAGKYGEEATGQSLSVLNATPKTSRWCGLAASAMVLMASSASFHQEFNCLSGANSNSTFCVRNAYAVALGVIGFIVGIIIVFLTSGGRLDIRAETGVSIVMLILTTAGVAVITFGDGPGTAPGNQYFSSWIAFGISLVLSAQCFDEMRGGSQDENDVIGTPASAPTIEEVHGGERFSKPDPDVEL